MKKILLSLLLTFLSSALGFAKYTASSKFFRVNAIYIDEVIEGPNGNESGEGVTAEFAFIFSDDDYFYASLGLEAGYLESDADGFALNIDMELIPVFANYTVGGDIEDVDLFWEAGFGLGFIYLDYQQSFLGFSRSDDDIVVGGQAFGRLGYEFTDSIALLVGARYIKTEDAKFSGSNAGDLSSLAFDLGLRVMF